MFILVGATVFPVQQKYLMLTKQTTFEDLVQVPPHSFVNNKITRQDLEDRINEKYSNKVCLPG